MYINQIFDIKNVYRQIIERWHDIEYETAIQDPKREGGFIIILFLSCIYCFNKKLSINGSTQKNQNILLLITPCQASVTPFFKNRNCSPHMDVLFTDILTLNPAVSNNNGYNGNGRYINTNLCLVCTQCLKIFTFNLRPICLKF